jgi:hypothetical protein
LFVILSEAKDLAFYGTLSLASPDRGLSFPRTSTALIE